MSLQTPYTNEQMLRLLSLAHRHSNPNLLDNWYFGNPVNQRDGYVTSPTQDYYATTSTSASLGKVGGYYKATYYNDTFYTFKMNGTTYYVNSKYILRGYVGAGYGIDRWRTNYSGDTIAITGNGVKNTNNSTVSGWHMHQIIEDNVKNLVGMTVTASFLINADTNSYFRPIMSFRDSSDSEISCIRANGATGLITFSGVVPTGTVKMRIGFYGYSGIAVGDYVEVKAIKLELGSVQTLAHQENGVWVLNDPPPNKQQELAKCQRYFVRLENTDTSGKVFLGLAKASTTTNATLLVPLPTSMRSRGTITFSGVEYSNSAASAAVAATSLVSVLSPITNNTRALNLVGTFTVGEVYSVWLAPGGYIDLSAEL